MDAVHPGGDEHLVQQPLHVDRQSHVAVVKERVDQEDKLINQERGKRRADQADLNDPKYRRKGDFPEVKAKAGGDVEIGVDVMDIVKAPQERNAVIRHVPVIEAQVEQ